jgi:trehalose/maltose hydrolase-like predicted phosphorylase
MLVYLLGPDELLSMLGELGFPMAADALTRTIDYYLARTAHGSTLSRVVHASVLARVDPARAWGTFRDALVADLDDTQGGTTKEGVHLGAMAGTVDIVTRAFAGVHFRDGALTFDPCLPEELRGVGFGLQYRGQRIDVTLDHARLQLAAHPCAAAPRVRIVVAGTDTTLGGGETLDFELPARPGPGGLSEPARTADARATRGH